MHLAGTRDGGWSRPSETAAEKADEGAAEEGAARSGRARESSREETGPDAPGGNQVRVMEPAVGDGG